MDEKSADLHKAVQLYFVPGWRNGAISGVPLASAIPMGTSTERANSKRANHGRSRLFQDAVSSVSFWLRSNVFTNVSTAAQYTQQLKILEDMFVVRDL